MTTFFDVATLTCFAALVAAFFQFTNRNPAILIRLLPSALTFAIANQVGNLSTMNGYVFALGLIFFGIGWALMILRKQ